MDVNGVSIVESKGDRKKFLEFPYKLYKNDPYWVAPLRMDQKKLVDTKKNPFFKNAEIALFIAEKNGQMAGRIAAVIDHRYNEYHKSKIGHFGFFDCIDDQPTADLLFKVAGDWLKEKGMEEVQGPANPSMLDMPGLLVEGFDKHPYVMMPYNKSYYVDLVEKAGFEKVMGLLAFVVEEETFAFDRIERSKKIVHKRVPNLVERDLKLSDFYNEAERIRLVYNEAWKDNWGFIPLTKEEMRYFADDLKLAVDRELANFIEVDGEVIAFSISLPDFNQIFRNMNGRLFPFGIFKLLLGKRKINRVRTALMGVMPKYQGKGLDALLHFKAIINGPKKGYHASELSWVLESNVEMIRVAEKLNGVVDKRYNIYGKKL